MHLKLALATILGALGAAMAGVVPEDASVTTSTKPLSKLEQIAEANRKANDHIVRCNDIISLRSEETWMFFHTIKGGALRADSALRGVGEAFVIECKGKVSGDAVEFGDTVFFKEERSGLYINEMGRYYGHLTVNPKRAGDFFQWVLFNPEGEQFRGPLFVNSAFAMRSNRQNFELYVRVLSHVGNARIDTTDFKPDYRKARFRAYKMHLDHEGGFKSLCPSDADGNVCSNHGQCANKYCACNENYEGERCEHELVDAKCFVVADPHVTSFDGARYNLFGAGEYLLWQEYRDSEREAVSAFFGPWNAEDPKSPSVAKIVTVRHYKHFVKFTDVGRAIYQDCDMEKDIAAEVKKAGKNGMLLKTGHMISWQPELNSWLLTNEETQTEIIIETIMNKKDEFNAEDIAYIDTTIAIRRPKRGHQIGICGNFDGQRDNDAIPRSKTGQNEIDEAALRKVRINDGRDYDFDRVNGRWNNEVDRSFYNCGSRTHEMWFHAPPKPSEVAPDSSAATTTIEDVLLFGKCKTEKYNRAKSIRCCRKVLVEARVMADGVSAPITTDTMNAATTAIKLQEAWSPYPDSPVPRSIDVRSDYLDCLQDMCDTDNEGFCKGAVENEDEEQAIQQLIANFDAKYDAIERSQEQAQAK